jgi:hypothetical protein
MDHWFDSLTKGMASYKPSRGTALASFATALAAAGSRWDVARAGMPPRPTPQPLTAKTANFGPCTVYSKGGHYEHHLVSRASASGHNAELRRTRTVDPKTGTTHDTTILVDGKLQLEVTGTFAKSSTQKFVFGDAFVSGGAVLTSTDGGKTFRGTIGGKTIAPYTIGSGKLRFVNGVPKRGKPAPGVSDAVKAVAKQADADLQQCTSNAHASLPNSTHVAKTVSYGPIITRDCGGYPNETLFQTSGNHSAPDMTCGEYYALLLGVADHNGKYQGQATTNTWFSQACEACQNHCAGFLAGVLDAFECLGSVLDECEDGCISCGKWAGYEGKQFNCQQGCQTSKACDPVPCGGGSCLRDQVCVYGGNYNETFGSTGYIPPICCPKTHPHVCGRAGGIYVNSNTIGQPWIGGYCCSDEAPCLFDTRFGSQSSSFNDNGYYCCPKEQICGSFKNGVYVGLCCFPKQHCCDGMCCGPDQNCAKLAGYDGTYTGAGSSTGCCPEAHIRDGKCCPNEHRCGNNEYCCPDGCANGKCAELCLSYQRTRNGTCCGDNVACGDVCCDNGCADPKTSKCKPKSTKCTSGNYECDFYPKGYLAKETVCCPKGQTCYEKCCPPKTVACANLKGVWGCFPQSQCAPTPPPPK